MSIHQARPASRALAVLLLALLAVAASGQEPARRPRVGLALGGGSARGIAHAGVLQWLEEHRVAVDAIAGTSTGAFVGVRTPPGRPPPRSRRCCGARTGT